MNLLNDRTLGGGGGAGNDLKYYIFIFTLHKMYAILRSFPHPLYTSTLHQSLTGWAKPHTPDSSYLVSEKVEFRTESTEHCPLTCELSLCISTNCKNNFEKTSNRSPVININDICCDFHLLTFRVVELSIWVGMKSVLSRMASKCEKELWKRGILNGIFV